MTPLTPETALVTADDAGTLAGGAGTLGAGGAGALAAGGAGTLAAGDAGALAGAGAPAAGALAGAGALTGAGMLTAGGAPGAAGVLVAGMLAAGPEGGLCDAGGWLGPLPWPGIRPWTAPTAESAALTAEPADEVIPPAPTAAASPLPGAFAGEPEVVAAEARPAISNAKMSAAANAPHAYRQPLRTRIKARAGVADPSTAQQATPDTDNHDYLGQPNRTGPAGLVRLKGI